MCGMKSEQTSNVYLFTEVGKASEVNIFTYPAIHVP